MRTHLTLRAAADVLQQAHDAPGLARLARIAGFTDQPAPLDRDSRRALGLDESLKDMHVVRGAGALRLLTCTSSSSLSIRDVVIRIATRLESRASHLFWLVAVAHASGHVAIAAWRGGRPPRVSALVVERGAVIESDAETVLSLAAIREPEDVLTHLRWLDVLGRQTLTRRFYLALEARVDDLARTMSGRASATDRRELALLCVSRLLFLGFLQTRGWLDRDHDFLSRTWGDAMRTGGQYHRRVLSPLFFGTLNTPRARRAATARAFGRIPFLNGGLFSRTALESRHRDATFDDESLGTLHGELLSRYRFTAREESLDFSEAAIDPEMLGRAFESLMAPATRKTTGAFYTPQPIVEHLMSEALEAALADRDPSAIVRLRILDPACGSGAFLVHALERITAYRAEHGDGRSPADMRRDVLCSSIFGVDLNPAAVWLCQLRLWLAVVIESEATDPSDVTPLPNLDRNVRVGDALAGEAFDAQLRAAGGATLRRLRERYARASGTRKQTLSREIDRLERRVAAERALRGRDHVDTQRRELLQSLRCRDLFGARRVPTSDDRATLAALRKRSNALTRTIESLRSGSALPFSWATHFADAAAAGGFDVVIGNPPWVRLHHIPAADRASLRERFSVFRHAGWERGGRLAHAGSGFGAQVDLASLFVERSIALTRPGGAIALLTPAKLWRSLAGGGTRALIAREASLVSVADHSSATNAFNAAVYPSSIVARRGPPPEPHGTIRVRVDDARGTRSWVEAWRHLPFDETPGSPWVMLPPHARRAFQLLAESGVPLADSVIGRPILGVKSGCNEAFIVRQGATTDISCRHLRPVVRGESIRRWSLGIPQDRIIWTHDASLAPLAQLPREVEGHLRGFRQRLLARTDARRTRAWWSLFRVAAARSDAHRVVWADLTRTPRAAVLAAGDETVPLNTCYVVRCRDATDAHAFATLLNSPLAAAWLGALAEPARGGYRRLLGWTVALLPVPRNWSRARDVLAPVGARAIEGHTVSDDELTDATARAFNLPLAGVQALLDWDIEHSS